MELLGDHSPLPFSKASDSSSLSAPVTSGSKAISTSLGMLSAIPANTPCLTKSCHFTFLSSSRADLNAFSPAAMGLRMSSLA